VQSPGRLTRRALLGLAGLAVVGCTKHPTHVPPKPAVVPDAAALASARSSEAALLATYDAKIASSPLHKRAPLLVARAIHATHLAALHGTATGTGTGTGAGSPVGSTSHVKRALRASAVQLRGLALAATDGTNAALLASIAASHETSAQ
jgi:hypothetical protein